jgi:hypothetical protein
LHQQAVSVRVAEIASLQQVLQHLPWGLHGFSF